MESDKKNVMETFLETITGAARMGRTAPAGIDQLSTGRDKAEGDATPKKICWVALLHWAALPEGCPELVFRLTAG